MLQDEKKAEENQYKQEWNRLKDKIDQSTKDRSLLRDIFYFIHMNNLCKVYDEVSSIHFCFFSHITLVLSPSSPPGNTA